MSKLAEHMVDFAERGNQQRITLKTGQMLQGWIMEITDDALLLSTGFAEKTGKDEWLNFEQIDLTRLEYWDSDEQHWLNWHDPE